MSTSVKLRLSLTPPGINPPLAHYGSGNWQVNDMEEGLGAKREHSLK